MPTMRSNFGKSAGCCEKPKKMKMKVRKAPTSKIQSSMGPYKAKGKKISSY